MTDPDSTPSAPSSNPAARRDGWSLEKQLAFLRALSATHSVTEAAKSVGMSRQSAYRLRSRLKGAPFDLAWEVAFHHSYDVLAHAALERALNGVEVPVYFQGEQVGSYRKYDERLTVALLGKLTTGGNPMFGRLGPATEKHARDFEALLARMAEGEQVATGALAPEDPSEFEGGPSPFESGQAHAPGALAHRPPDWAPMPCPSTMSDAQLTAAIEAFRAGEGR